MSNCRRNEHDENKPVPVEIWKFDGTKDEEGKLKYKIVKHKRPQNARYMNLKKTKTATQKLQYM